MRLLPSLLLMLVGFHATSSAGEIATNAGGQAVFASLKGSDGTELARSCEHLYLFVVYDARTCAGRARREREAWLRLRDDYRAHGLDVYLVLKGSTASERTADPDFPVLSDRDNRLGNLYGVEPAWSPTKLLVDCQGRLLYFGLAARDKEERMTMRSEVTKALILWRESTERSGAKTGHD